MTAIARQAAEAWLRNYLCENGATEGRRVITEALAAGFPRATIYRAVKFLDVVKRYEAGGVTWELEVPTQWEGPV